MKLVVFVSILTVMSRTHMTKMRLWMWKSFWCSVREVHRCASPGVVGKGQDMDKGPIPDQILWTA